MQDDTTRAMRQGRGTLILALGIAAILFTVSCYCIPVGVILAIPCRVMGRKDLRLMDQEEMDPSDRTLVKVGVALAIASVILAAIILAIAIMFGFFAGALSIFGM